MIIIVGANSALVRSPRKNFSSETKYLTVFRAISYDLASLKNSTQPREGLRWIFFSQIFDIRIERKSVNAPLKAGQRAEVRVQRDLHSAICNLH